MTILDKTVVHVGFTLGVLFGMQYVFNLPDATIILALTTLYVASVLRYYEAVSKDK